MSLDGLEIDLYRKKKEKYIILLTCSPMKVSLVFSLGNLQLQCICRIAHSKIMISKLTLIFWWSTNSKMDSQSFAYFCTFGLFGNMPFEFLECEF